MKKRKKEKRPKKNETGLKKLAKITSQSLSNVYAGYKKNQKLKKLENARIEKISQKKNLSSQKINLKKTKKS